MAAFQRAHLQCKLTTKRQIRRVVSDWLRLLRHRLGVRAADWISVGDSGKGLPRFEDKIRAQRVGGGQVHILSQKIKPASGEIENPYRPAASNSVENLKREKLLPGGGSIFQPEKVYAFPSSRSMIVRFCCVEKFSGT